jgi:hypothetical protein
MKVIKEENHKGPSTIQGFRTYDPTVFYEKQQKAKDQEWVRLATEQLRKAANTSIVV